MRRAEASPAQAGLDLLALFFSLSTLRRPNGGGNEASMPSPSCLKGGDGYRDQGHPARVQGQLTYKITCNLAHLQGYIASVLHTWTRTRTPMCIYGLGTYLHT